MVLVDALVGENGLLETVKTRETHRGLEQSIARLRQDNARLRQEAALLLDDPATIEAHARRDLGLIRRGETLFIIRDVPPAATAQAEPDR